MPNFMRNCQTVIQITCTILYSHHQCIKIPIAPHSCQYLVLCFNLLIFLHSIESVVWCYLIVALIYISLLTNDAEYFFMCLFIGYLYIPFKYFAHFKNWLVFFTIELEELFIYFGYKSHAHTCFANTFSQ